MVRNASYKQYLWPKKHICNVSLDEMKQRQFEDKISNLEVT